MDFRHAFFFFFFATKWERAPLGAVAKRADARALD
jgi:hypothetical protein